MFDLKTSPSATDAWALMDEHDLVARNRGALFRRRVSRIMSGEGTHEERAHRTLAVIMAGCAPCEPWPGYIVPAARINADGR